MEVLLFLFPVFIFLFLVYLFLKSLSAILLITKLTKENNLTVGNVIVHESKLTGYTPIIQFEDREGNKIEGVAQNVKITKNDIFQRYCIGNEVEVYYSSSDATFFIVKSKSHLLLWVVLIVIGGVLLSIIFNILKNLFS